MTTTGAPMEEAIWTSGDANPPPTAEATKPEQPLAEEPFERVADAKDANIENTVDKDAADAKYMEEGNAQHSSMQRSASSWTESSDESSHSDAASHKSVIVERRKWSEKINPLKKKHVPPIPNNSGPSPEYTAGFISLLTFQWMAPLMNVCRKINVCIVAVRYTDMT